MVCLRAGHGCAAVWLLAVLCVPGGAPLGSDVPMSSVCVCDGGGVVHTEAVWLMLVGRWNNHLHHHHRHTFQ